VTGKTLAMLHRAFSVVLCTDLCVAAYGGDRDTWHAG